MSAPLSQPYQKIVMLVTNPDGQEYTVEMGKAILAHQDEPDPDSVEFTIKAVRAEDGFIFSARAGRHV